MCHGAGFGVYIVIRWPINFPSRSIGSSGWTMESLARYSLAEGPFVRWSPNADR